MERPERPPKTTSIGVTAVGNYAGSSTTATNRKQTITVGSQYLQFHCWTNPDSPPTGNPLTWPVAAVSVFVTDWKSGYFPTVHDNLGVQECPAANTDDYGPGSFTRSVGSSYTIENAYTASLTWQGRAGSFSGSANVSMADTSGEAVSECWTNAVQGTKRLCGVNTPSIAAVANVGPDRRPAMTEPRRPVERRSTGRHSPVQGIWEVWGRWRREGLLCGGRRRNMARPGVAATQRPAQRPNVDGGGSGS